MFIAMRWWDVLDRWRHEVVGCFGHVAPVDVLEGCNPKKNSAESDSSHRGDHPRRLYELHVFGCYGVPSKNDG